MKNALQGTFRAVTSLVAVGNTWRWCLACLMILGLSSCANPAIQKADWRSLDGPKASFVAALAKDPTNPRILYAGMLNGGVLRSTDGGESWHLLDSQPFPRSDSTGVGEPDYALDIESICASCDGQIFVATLGQGVCAHMPDGTWMGLRRGLSAESFTATEVAVGGDNDQFLYVGTQSGIYVLTRPAYPSDRWKRLDEWGTSPAEQVQTLFASSEITPHLYVGTQGGFFRSTDGGENWYHSTQGIDRDILIVAMAVDPENLDHLVVSDWERHIYASADGGETWQKSTQVFDSVVEDLIFSAVTPGMIYAVTYGSGGLHVSLDGGLTWELEDQIGVPVLSLLQTDEGRLVVGTDGDGILFRDSSGGWIPARVLDSPILTVQSLLPGGGDLYVGTACCGVFRRTSDGEWQRFGRGLPRQARFVNVLVADNQQDAICAGTNGNGVYVHRTDPDGWNLLRDGLPRSAWQVRSLVLFEFGSEQIFLAGTDDGLYRLNDQSIWERTAPLQLAQEVDNLLWEPRTKTLFATATGGELYVSQDGGRSWSRDEQAPKQINRLALTSSTALQRFFLGSAPWTLFAQTRDGSLYYRTSSVGWQQAEIESEPNEQISIWSYPYQADGFLLVRTTQEDERIRQRIPPLSSATLIFQRAGWKVSTSTVNAGITVAVPDSQDREVLYAGTANSGVYSTRIALPSLWEQIPAGSLIKMALPTVALVVVLAILALLLYLRLKRPPKPVELEVEITATAQADNYRIQVRGPEKREDQVIVSLPGSFLELKESRGEFFAGPTRREEVYATGKDLFEFIYGASAIQSIYATSRGHARKTTLRLRLCPAGELAELPWEVLCDPHVEQPLALTRKYSITRRTKSAEPLPEWKPSRRLNVLAAIASPQELPIPMIEREVEVLREMSGRLRQVEMRVIEHATPKALLAELQANAYQILHFAGHADRSGLILEDERGHQAQLGVLDLAPVISGSALTMVFLNACETAGSGFRAGIPSLASMLANKGVPLVLAMQHEIPNDDALSFVRSFYDALVDTGSVDDAVSRGRQAIYRARESVAPPTWAIPVLLIRGSNSELVRPSPRWRRGLDLRRQPIQKDGKL